VVEIAAIRRLTADGAIVIAAGGGGIPVAKQWDGSYHGVEAVIDKDLASSLLARLLGCETLCIITGVDRVALHYGKPEQRELACATADELSRYAAEGHFPAGSMGPKIQAAIEFVRGGGRDVVITSPSKIRDALEGSSGTRIVRE
jgi:carbamate kinase